MYVASSYMARANRLSWLRTKSYVCLQSSVTTGSCITKRSILQYIADHITTTLCNVTTYIIMNGTMQHCNYITATLHYATLPFLQCTVAKFLTKTAQCIPGLFPYFLCTYEINPYFSNFIFYSSFSFIPILASVPALSCRSTEMNAKAWSSTYSACFIVYLSRKQQQQQHQSTDLRHF